MPANTKHELREHYILYTATGKYSGKERGIEVFHEFIQLAQLYHCNKILVDLQGLEDIPPVTERYELGEIAAKVWRYDLKVAIVAQADIITGFFENVMVNRGARARVFPDFAEAEQWLMHG